MNSIIIFGLGGEEGGRCREQKKSHELAAFYIQIQNALLK